MPKNQEKEPQLSWICCSQCPRRILGIPKEIFPFPASGICRSCKSGMIQGQLQEFQQQLVHLPRGTFSRGIFPFWIQPHPHVLPSFSSSFSQEAPANPGGFGSFFPQILGSGGAVELLRTPHYLFPGVIPKGFIPKGLFHPPASVCSSPVRIKALEQMDLPKEFPLFFSPPSLPPHLGIPKAGSGKSSGIRKIQWDQEKSIRIRFVFFLMLKIIIKKNKKNPKTSKPKKLPGKSWE